MPALRVKQPLLAAHVDYSPELHPASLGPYRIWCDRSVQELQTLE